jgi:hypothetical protein
MIALTVLAALLPLLYGLAEASPVMDGEQQLSARQAVDNIVYVTDATSFWYAINFSSPYTPTQRHQLTSTLCLV